MTPCSLPPVAEMYDALVRRDTQYEGTFILGVKTTGIFCRPSCPARKPQARNVEYFASCRDAVLAGYRPCRRCRPLEQDGAPPEWLRDLLIAIEADPERRWRDADLRARGLEPARVRRWFSRVHGLTFHGYQRARRLGVALGRIRQGADLTDTAYGIGYESPSAFRDAFVQLFGTPPGHARDASRVVVNRILTPLGAMVAAATDDALCLLEYADRRGLATQVARLRAQLHAHFVPGESEVLARTAAQVAEYFARTRTRFDLPLALPGTEFQRAAWAQLQTIPYGGTRTYAEQAAAIGRPNAVRAVGRANGDNRIAIVVPCHRVVGASGELTGYGGQLWRKRALLELERREEPAPLSAPASPRGGGSGATPPA
jgi:AraC family transcriptional regulator of adaptative response/methylated-DNA-[protein]-cysteine methyltransferase